jgi:hypothetical protein
MEKREAERRRVEAKKARLENPKAQIEQWRFARDARAYAAQIAGSPHDAQVVGRLRLA